MNATSSTLLEKIGPVTYAAPPNDFGVFAIHDDGRPFTIDEVKAIIKYRPASANSKLQAELSKTACCRTR